MYFHTDNRDSVEFFIQMLAQAFNDDRRIRINVDEHGSLTYKIGEGGWSHPIRSTPDPYRDPQPDVTLADEIWLENHGTD
jgi:hypothetical protein